jgi:DNA-binding CsgD family transcriptional regulator
LDVDELRREADRLLRPAIAYDVGVWATLDPASLLSTSCVMVGHEPDSAEDRVVFESEWLYEDVNRFSELALRGDAASLAQVTGGDLESSRRYRELLGPIGVVDELRAAFVSDGACWGGVVLLRFHGRESFSEDEVARVAQIGPVMAEALRLAILGRAARSPASGGDGPGVIVLAADGTPATSTPAAQRRVAEAANPADIPNALLALDAATRAAAGGQTNDLVRSRIPAADGGWLILHGSLTDDREQVAIVIERAHPPELADIIVSTYGFTAREREVVSLVLQGHSNKRIALTLAISAYTVQDHLKAAFAKAKVTSRGELAAMLTDRHYEPAISAGEHPSPYGWFLSERAS